MSNAAGFLMVLSAGMAHDRPRRRGDRRRHRHVHTNDCRHGCRPRRGSAPHAHACAVQGARHTGILRHAAALHQLPELFWELFRYACTAALSSRRQQAEEETKRGPYSKANCMEQRTFPAALLAVFAELSDGLSTRVQVTAPGAAAGAAAAPANAPRTQSTSISATATYLMWPTSTPAPRC